MQKKLIMLDVDGTILNTKNEIPTSAKEAIQAAQAAGHEVVIATGRAPYFIEEIRAALDIHSFVCFNGQYVEAKGELVYHNPMQPNELEQLFTYSKEQGHPLVYMGGEAMRSTIDRSPEMEASFASINIDSTKILTNPDYYKESSIYQTLLYCNEQDEHHYIGSTHDFHYIRWHEHSLDVLPKGGSKAKGIEQYMKAHGFHVEDVYAFGDQRNDLEMLAFVGHGVAMGNAPEDVKEVARYVTDHVDEDGLANAFERLGLI